MGTTARYAVENTIQTTRTPTEDEVVQINMGNEDHPKPIFISKSLTPEEKDNLVSLLREYINVFAWSFEDMPGLNPQVAMYRLNIKPDVKLVKQQQRQFRPDIMGAIEAEVNKLIESGFIRESNIPTGWPISSL